MLAAVLTWFRRGDLRGPLGVLAWVLVGCSHPDGPKTDGPPSTGTSTGAGSAGSATEAALDHSGPPPPSVGPSAKPPPVRLSFAGDLALTMSVGAHLSALAAGRPVPAHIGPDFPFSQVGDRLRSADLLVGNLECVRSWLGEVSTNHNPFRCPPAAIDALKRAGFDLVSVANNHALDYGEVGFRDMIRNLEAGGLAHFGQESFTPKPQPPFIRKIRGIKVGLLAYYYPPIDPKRDVKAARSQVDVLAVFNHWGPEGEVEPLPLQQRLARAYIDGGADLVVGTHAHVVQPIAWHRGKLIAYGIGNFVFAGMGYTASSRRGALLEVDITPAGIVAHRMVSISLDDDGAPRFEGDPAAAARLEPPTR
jgi:hypothetical protein